MPQAAARTAARTVSAALLIALALVACGEKPDGAGTTTASDTTSVLDTACGQCQFGLDGEAGECDLAVRVDGRALFVTGTAIDDHGDAHTADGFCNAVRRARVTGRVEDDRFAVTSLQLLPEASADGD